MSQSLTERYDDRIAGILSCYDRLVITGTLPVVCYAAGMTGYLNAKGIRIFDYPEFAKTLRECVRDRAASMAAEAGVTIEHIAKPHVQKEDVVARVLQQRGDHPGLVHIISAMEACDAYKPWHDKQTHKTFIRPDSGKCLHYYFYFQDAKFGLIYLRVPTWAPFRLQFYCNGHSWLARKLTAKGIGYTMADNAFVRIVPWIGTPHSAARCPRYSGSPIAGASQVEGTCIKHRFGKCAIKMYDKHGIVLRIAMQLVRRQCISQLLGARPVVDQAVDRLLERCEFPGRGAGAVFHLSVVLEERHIVGGGLAMRVENCEPISCASSGVIGRPRKLATCSAFTLSTDWRTN